jgi:hypothetical protein
MRLDRAGPWQSAASTEDVRGVHGCAQFLGAIANPQHEEHERYLAGRLALLSSSHRPDRHGSRPRYSQTRIVNVRLRAVTLN